MARPKRFELLTPRFVVWCFGSHSPPERAEVAPTRFCTSAWRPWRVCRGNHLTTKWASLEQQLPNRSVDVAPVATGQLQIALQNADHDPKNTQLFQAVSSGR